MNRVFLIGYSGHAFVVCDIFLSNGINPFGYFEQENKKNNPYNLQYCGSEYIPTSINRIKQGDYFVAIGSNNTRKEITSTLKIKVDKLPVNAIHRSAIVSSAASLGSGVMIGPGATINACARIEDGVICNTTSVIEHECHIGAFSHIAPGAVLCGNVQIGENTLVGARAVIKPGIRIGDNVTIGAGTVVLTDIPDGSKVVGNPQKIIV